MLNLLMDENMNNLNVCRCCLLEGGKLSLRWFANGNCTGSSRAGWSSRWGTRGYFEESWSLCFSCHAAKRYSLGTVMQCMQRFYMEQ